MKEYNFDENKNMGETVRIDDIKTRLSELDDQDYYDDDDDDGYDDFDDFGRTAEVSPVRRGNERQGGGGQGRRGNGGNKTVLYIIAAAVMVIVVAAAVIFAMNGGKSGEKPEEENVGETADYFYGVVVSVSDNRFEITDIQSGKTSFYTIDSTAEIIRSDGIKTVYSSIARGDIINVGVSKETGDVVRVEYTDEVWEKKNFADVEVDTAARTISNGVTSYSYDKNTLFIYNNDFM